MAERTASLVESLESIDRRRIIHPYLPGGSSERVVMVRGKGCELWDARGRRYLDATGGLWLAQIGHGRAELADVAREQMARLEYFTAFWEFSNDRAVELAERLATMAPGDLGRVFFTSGGSEGNDAAIKLARYFHHERGETDRNVILSRRSAYHGVAYGSGTATGIVELQTGFGPLVPDVLHLTQPAPYHPELFGGEEPAAFCVRELEQTIARVGAGRIAAFIGEPVMGVAGMVVPPAGYWPAIAEVLEAHGILLILDEVVTGFGRTGAWFAAETYGLEPDILVTAKGLTSGYAPLGAVLVSEAIGDVVTRGDHGFPMGYTYAGHPVSCAVALANLAVIEREQLVERAATVGATMFARLQELASIEVVGDVRHAGLGLALELVSDRDARTTLVETARPIPDLIREETGVIVRESSPGNIVFSPPLVISEAEVEEAVAAAASVIARVRPDGSIATTAG
jgi:adenosylmethionine-8-amino-7-oxononanoate aminotransferase